MTTSRPAIPRPMARAVKTEAGHRCAIPTCRQPVGLQIHHIVDYAKVQDHTFDNLILLCANCHARVTNGEIDTLSVKQYKANLSVLNGRYGEFERRVLDAFARNPDGNTIDLPEGRTIDLMYLLSDGLLTKVASPAFAEQGVEVSLLGMPVREGFRLTAKGREFVNNWLAAKAL